MLLQGTENHLQTRSIGQRCTTLTGRLHERRPVAAHSTCTGAHEPWVKLDANAMHWLSRAGHG